MSVDTCKFCLYNDKNKCRRYPPDLTGKLPTINKNDWCGEFVDYEKGPTKYQNSSVEDLSSMTFGGVVV